MTVRSVAIDTVDGEQIKLDRGMHLYAADGAPIWLDQVADALADANAWVEYETEVHWRPNNAVELDLEPWQEPEPEPEYRSRARIYARAVVQVLTIYDEVVEPADA